MEAQRNTIERYFDYRIKPQGIAIGGCIVDAAVSGTVPFAERAGGRKLNESLLRGDHVVFAKLDRGFRRVTDCLLTVEKWKDRGIVLHALDLNVDTSTEIGELILGVMAHFAQWERRRISERIREAIAAKVRAGYKLQGQTPHGFKYVGAKGRRRLVPCERSMAELAKIVELRSTGMQYDELYKYLRDNKVQPVKGGSWSLSRVYAMYQAALKLMRQKRLEDRGRYSGSNVPVLIQSSPSTATHSHSRTDEKSTCSQPSVQSPQ